MIDNPIFSDETRILDSRDGIVTYPEAKIFTWPSARQDTVSLEITSSGSNERTIALINLDKTQVRAIIKNLEETLLSL